MNQISDDFHAVAAFANWECLCQLTQHRPNLKHHDLKLLHLLKHYLGIAVKSRKLNRRYYPSDDLRKEKETADATRKH